MDSINDNGDPIFAPIAANWLVQELMMMMMMIQEDTYYSTFK